MTDERSVAEYFEAAIKANAQPKQAANWIMGDIAAYLNHEKLSISKIALKPTMLAELVTLIENGTISGKIAKDILPELLVQGGSPQELVERKGLIQISDTGALAAIIDQVLVENPKELEQYRHCKTKLLGFFVGKVLKQTGGRADPKLTNQLLDQKLNS